MRLSYTLFLFFSIFCIQSFAYSASEPTSNNWSRADTINTGDINPKDLLNYAETLLGIPYKYGSTNPNIGFDCSGFITYVFNHFNIAVPRSSKDFTYIAREVNVKDAKQGDIILFTGTNNAIRKVGHMGIIISNLLDECEFIHSSSGKVRGVTITPLNKYYQGRFLKVIRVFKQNDLL